MTQMSAWSSAARSRVALTMLTEAQSRVGVKVGVTVEEGVAVGV